jgi:2-polyprenyl-3-methyl-5-hydroxy-6-metoxy-1,4-benzoquinol methylase
MADVNMENIIQSFRITHCFLCGVPGALLYKGLRDRLYNATGEWDLKRCPNSDCGLIWLDPMPTEDDIGKAYQSYYTHRARNISQNAMRKAYYAVRDGYLGLRYGYPCSMWKRFLAPLMYLNPGRRGIEDFNVAYQFAPRPGSRLLEIGCGSGERLKLFSNLGWDAEGTDVDPKAVEKVRNMNLKVHLGTLSSLAYGDESFDVIFINHVIEHVHRPLGLLKECCRILRLGGSLVVATPNVHSLGHRLFKENWKALDPPRHLYLFNHTNMSRMIKLSGLETEYIGTLARRIIDLVMGIAVLLGDKSHNFNRVAAAWEELLTQALYFPGTALYKFKPDLGEEVVHVAKKPH